MWRNSKLILLASRIKRYLKVMGREFVVSLRETGEYFRRRGQITQLYKLALPTNQSVGPVLFWVPGGMTLLLEVENTIAIALQLRGIRSHVVVCDGAYRACILREVTDGQPVERWKDSCKSCKARTTALLKKMCIPHSFIGDYVPASLISKLWDMTESITWETLDDLEYGGVNLAKSTRSAIIRFLTGEDLAAHQEVVREYAFSALVCAAASSRAMQEMSPSRLFLSHGVYVDWGPALQTALARGIAVSGWKPSYLYAHFYFRHIDDGARLGFHRLGQIAWDKRKSLPLTSVEETRLNIFMSNRYENRVSFDLQELKPYNGNMDAVRQKYVPDTKKPVWGIFCHIVWDSVKDYSPMAFDSFNDWIMVTLNEIIQIQDVNWLVKIHPVEARNERLLGVQHLIDTHFPILPPHVRVISAHEDISPLEFFQLIDGGISVYGTSGLELALQGKPVILAGEAHYGGKGFTYDGLTTDDYVNLLHQTASFSRLSGEQVDLARRYAYNYFIQREIPLEILNDPTANEKKWKFQYERRELLLPGGDPFIDFVCEHIQNGQDFVMEDDLVALAKPE